VIHAQAVAPDEDVQDFETLLAKCDEFSTKGIYGEGNRTRLKAMLLLLRYSGLRIRDAATLHAKRPAHAPSVSRPFAYQAVSSCSTCCRRATWATASSPRPRCVCAG